MPRRGRRKELGLAGARDRYHDVLLRMQERCMEQEGRGFFVEEMERLVALWLRRDGNVTMAAGNQRITIEQGATFQLPINWKPGGTMADLSSGYTARMQVRRSHADSDTLVSLTDSSGITLSANTGDSNIDVLISATATAAIDTGNAKIVGVWDLEVEDSGGVVTRILEGECVITPEVTR